MVSTKLLQTGWNALRTWGTPLVKGGAHTAASGLRFAAKNPKFTFVGSGIAVGMYTGNGALRTWANWVGGGDAKETVAEKVNRVVNGEKAHGGNVVGDTLDSVTGEGTAQKIVDTVSAVKDGIVDTAQSTKDLVSRNMPSLPSMGQYTDQQMAQVTGQYPAQYPQQGGAALADFSPFTGFRHLLNTVTGGNTNMMSVAAMIPAAMLMFGNFGWMGKIASLMLGSMAVKNLNHPYSAQRQQTASQVHPQLVQEQYLQNYQEHLAQSGCGVDQGKDNVVMRNRSC